MTMTMTMTTAGNEMQSFLLQSFLLQSFLFKCFLLGGKHCFELKIEKSIFKIVEQSKFEKI